MWQRSRTKKRPQSYLFTVKIFYFCKFYKNTWSCYQRVKPPLHIRKRACTEACVCAKFIAYYNQAHPLWVGQTDDLYGALISVEFWYWWFSGGKGTEIICRDGYWVRFLLLSWHSEAWSLEEVPDGLIFKSKWLTPMTDFHWDKCPWSMEQGFKASSDGFLPQRLQNNQFWCGSMGTFLCSQFETYPRLS